MRGLTNEERYVLTCSVGTSPTSLRNVLDLRKRGLIHTEREADGGVYYTVLAAGELALRLDAAARQLEGVSA